VAGTAAHRRAAAGVGAGATKPSTPGAGTSTTTKPRKPKGDGYSQEECTAMVRARQELRVVLPSSSGAGCLVFDEFLAMNCAARSVCLTGRVNRTMQLGEAARHVLPAREA